MKISSANDKGGVCRPYIEEISDLELARSLVRRGQFEELELFYESTPNVLSELIRTAFIPKEGCRFIVADFFREITADGRWSSL